MPNGDFIVSSSRDKTIKLWAVATGWVITYSLWDCLQLPWIRTWTGLHRSLLSVCFFTPV